MKYNSKCVLWAVAIGVCVGCVSKVDHVQSNDENHVLAVDSIMNAWHHAASVSDSSTYFGTMASSESIFIGTDETERWTTGEFKIWSRKYFKRASAWTFIPVKGERHIRVHGDVAWLDEKLDSDHMGRCRGTAILTFNSDERKWKIEHYTLSYAVPNEVADSLTQMISSWKASGRVN